MFARRLFRLAVAGAALAAAAGPAAPARAAVFFNPERHTGYVGAAEVRQAFGWTDAVLTARAPGITFDQGFYSYDTYTVICAAAPFPLDHYTSGGHFDLRHAVVLGSAGGGTPAGFVLDGAVSGVSGITAMPGPGDDCPRVQGEPAGAKVLSTEKVSSTDGWSLIVRSGADYSGLRAHETTIR